MTKGIAFFNSLLASWITLTCSTELSRSPSVIDFDPAIAFLQSGETASTWFQRRLYDVEDSDISNLPQPGFKALETDSFNLNILRRGNGIDRPQLMKRMKAVLRVHVTSIKPDFGQPWRMDSERRSTGSGFPIENNLVITNAHVISFARIVEIERPGIPDLFMARVVSVAHEPDLAILEVPDPAFWHDLPTMSLTNGGSEGDTIPKILEDVLVMGYPTGGNKLSITRGVVNRVEVGSYSHSNTDLLEIQIDAAINPGNSGGPVIDAQGDVVGVAFQGLRSADSIGYIIPVPIIEQILQDLKINGKYTGMCTLGVSLQDMSNPMLQEFVGLNDIDHRSLPESVDSDGALVTAVDTAGLEETFDTLKVAGRSGEKIPTEDLSKDTFGFRRGDVILSLDGHNVASDATIAFRDTERLALTYLLIGKFGGTILDAVVLRDNVPKNIRVPISPPDYLVPRHTEGLLPRYLIYGGIVFVPLTVKYILDYKQGSQRLGLSTVAKSAQRKFSTAEQEEIIVLSRMLSSKLTRGLRFNNSILKAVNGINVRSLVHLHELLYADVSDTETTDKAIKFTFVDTDKFLVMDSVAAKAANADILKKNLIVSEKSSSLEKYATYIPH